MWDTTLVLDAVEICGYPDDIASNPPFIVVEMFDEDVLVSDVHKYIVRTSEYFIEMEPIQKQ